MTNEKVITILNSLKQYYNDKNEDSYVGFDNEDNEALDTAIKLLEQTRWIPCSERLPEKNGNYLVTVKYKPERDYDDIYTEYGEWRDGEWDVSGEYCGVIEDIIAWMPLPSSYQGEENG